MTEVSGTLNEIRCFLSHKVLIAIVQVESLVGRLTHIEKDVRFIRQLARGLMAEVLKLHVTLCVCFDVVSYECLMGVSLTKSFLIVVYIARMLPCHGDPNPQLYWHPLALLRVCMAMRHLLLL